MGAARRVAGEGSGEAVVLASTNNVVARLGRVVAKVGTWSHSGEVLARELVVGRALAEADAPTVRPWPSAEAAGVVVDGPTGWPVTLWCAVDAVGRPENVAAAEVAASLRQLHGALSRMGGHDPGLPSWHWGLDLAADTLGRDEAMAAMAADDLRFLRDEFARLRAEVDGEPEDAVLHGEPHGGNVLVTAEGLRWLDFEGACLGPLEWDLASQGPEVATAYGGLDQDRLAVARAMNSARVAVWCWAGAHRGDLRVHAEHHLRVLRGR